ncbi:MAG: hypothetical protein H6719_29050 [Sandaracinaceae bacterium]|nr:hypothetical protein [Sandaracinaceae bacterium]
MPRLRTLLAAALALAASSAQAQDESPRSLVHGLEVLEDPTGALTIEDVTRPPWSARFGAMPEGRLLGRSRSAFWLRTRLEHLDQQDGWRVELAHPEADDVRVYWPRPDGTFEALETGDRTPFATRPLPHPTFVFPVPAGDSVTLHARVQMEGGVQIPLRLWTASAFDRHARDLALGLGGFYAFVLALALYNLFLFFTTRERGYLAYVLFQLSVVGFAAAFEGHGAMYLWPNAPGWAHVAGPVLLSLTYAFGTLYLHEMANVQAFAPRLALVMRVVAGLDFALAVASTFAYEIATAALEVASLLAIATAPVPIVVSLRRGWTPSRYLLAGWLAMGPAAALGALRATDQIEESFLTEHGFEIGVAVEALLLSFALAERIRVLRRAKEDAEADALEMQRKAARAQEEERRRIAADLHDGVGQQLQVLIARADAADDGAEVSALARESVAEIRRVARDLHPHELDRLGLAEAVRRVAERTLEAAGVEPEIVVEDVDGLLPKERWIDVYRALQEALANVVRHADATSAIVALRREADALVLRVEDDGRGIAADVEPGLGTASLHERARLLGGALDVESAPGDGTRVALRVPLG